MSEIDFMSSLHKSTQRNYLARVNDNEFPKAKAAKLAKEIGCDYFEVKPSFDPFHFLNDTSQTMANIIKDELHKCTPLVDDEFKIISPYTLPEVISAIIYAGAKPVYVDLDVKTGLPDSKKLYKFQEKLIFR